MIPLLFKNAINSYLLAMTVGWGGGYVQIQSGPRFPKFVISGGYKSIVTCTRQRVLGEQREEFRNVFRQF